MRAFPPLLGHTRRCKHNPFSHVRTDFDGVVPPPRFFSKMAPSRHPSSPINGVKVTPWGKPSRDSVVKDSESPSNGTRAKKRAYIALGSNIGDRIGMIEKACNEMSARGIKVTRTSSLWETEPMYFLDQNHFVNGACEVETSLEPIPLLNELQDIENLMGRKKIVNKGPRNIDLDILLYEDQVLEHPRLTLPHPGIPEREFVLRPLAELIPQQPLHPAWPWKLTQDYLNVLPVSETSLSTLTPLASHRPPLHGLKIDRPTQVMGILNVTPDSFSDGRIHTIRSLSSTISSLIENGATIIDVGGQSSAPGAVDVSVEEEISRILPPIKLIRNHLKGHQVAISVDTYRSQVAEAAIEAGADIINDISGGVLDPQILSTVSKLGRTICLMHMRGNPTTMNKLTHYEPHGLIPTVAHELLERVAAAEAAGIRRWRLILDPGIGFAKTGAQNLEILRSLDELRDWPGLRGLPWLVGSSRKKFIGTVTGVTEPTERSWGTAATVAAAVQGGADIVRVHDVKEMVQVVKMADAIWRDRHEI